MMTLKIYLKGRPKSVADVNINDVKYLQEFYEKLKAAKENDIVEFYNLVFAKSEFSFSVFKK